MPTAQSKAPAQADATPASPPVAESADPAPPAFAARANAFPQEFGVSAGAFGPALAYAPGAAFNSGGDPFPFVLRGSFAERTSPFGQQGLAERPPARPPANSRPQGDRATRLASLTPLSGLPAGPAATAPDIAALVTAKAEKHGVPVNLAHAVVQVESNYKPSLVGRGATLGLMQIKYATARGIGFTGTAKELFDPATNLEWGMRYLAGAHRLAKGDVCGTVLRYQSGHRAMHMHPTASLYCSKVRRLMAAAATPRRSVDARNARASVQP